MTRFEFYGNLNKYHDANSLEHRESPLKGSQRQNAKYIRREGEPGNYRYIYKEVNKPNGTKQVVAEEWNIDDYIKQERNEEKRRENIYKNFDYALLTRPVNVLEEYHNNSDISALDVVDNLGDKYYEMLSDEYGKDLHKAMIEALKKDEAEEDPDDRDNAEKIIKFVEKRTTKLQEAAAKQEKMNQQNYENRKNADKYAEEDRWTDYNDKREREEALKGYAKRMGLADDKIKLLNKYIKSNDSTDLSELEKILTPTEKAVLQNTLLGLQKESFMGHRIRKDGSLR